MNIIMNAQSGMIEIGPNALIAILAVIAIVQLVFNQLTTRKTAASAKISAAQLMPDAGRSALDKINSIVDSNVNTEKVVADIAAIISAVNERLIVVEADAHSNARAAAVAASNVPVSTPLPPPPPKVPTL